jgi:ribosome-binding ATPase YchF (GTP1/OBG family)
MTPLHTDDDQIRRLDEMIRALHEHLIAANEARHDKAVKNQHLQRLQNHARRVLAELTLPVQGEPERENRVFDLDD